MRLADSALRRWRRVHYRGTVSRPYLSGDLFRALCDAALDGMRGADRQFVRSYRHARSLFVKTDRLAEFLGVFADAAVECRTLITGNSDLEIHAVPVRLPPRLQRWYAQNAFVTSDVIRPLPIGLENQALGVNGLLRDFRRCGAADLDAKGLSVFAGFAPTTSERESLTDRLRVNRLIAVEPRRLSPAAYQSRLRSARFVIAPRGNGVDTHRFWEALYADAIPVTRRSAWSRAFAAEGVPMIEVDEWDEVLRWSEHDLLQRSAALPQQPSALPWLWEPFWRARIAGAGAGNRAS